MNTSTTVMNRLKKELGLKEFFQNNVVECDYNASEAIYELFDPFLEVIKQQVTIPADYDLIVEAHCFMKTGNSLFAAQKHVIDLIFTWEPIKDDGDYMQVKFSSFEKRLINNYLREFSLLIGMEVEFSC